MCEKNQKPTNDLLVLMNKLVDEGKTYNYKISSREELYEKILEDEEK